MDCGIINELNYKASYMVLQSPRYGVKHYSKFTKDIIKSIDGINDWVTLGNNKDL